MPLFGLNLGGFVKKAKDELGGIADAIIPGDQSYLHGGGTAPGAPTAPQASTIGQINQATGFGQLPSVAPAPQLKAPDVPSPQPNTQAPIVGHNFGHFLQNIIPNSQSLQAELHVAGQGLQAVGGGITSLVNKLPADTATSPNFNSLIHVITDNLVKPAAQQAQRSGQIVTTGQASTNSADRAKDIAALAGTGSFGYGGLAEGSNVVANPLLNRILTRSAEGAAASGLSGGAYAYGQGGNTQDILKASLASGALGAGIGGALGLVPSRAGAPIEEAPAAEVPVKAPVEPAQAANHIEAPPVETPVPNPQLAHLSTPDLAAARQQVINNLTQHNEDLAPHINGNTISQTPEAQALLAQQGQAQMALQHINDELSQRFQTEVLGQAPQEVKPGDTVSSTIRIGNEDVPVTETKSTLGQPAPANPPQPGEETVHIQNPNTQVGDAAALAKNISDQGVASDLNLTSNPIKETRRAKAALSKGEIVRRQGEAGQTTYDIMNKAVRDQAQYEGNLRSKLEPFFNLKKPDAELVRQAVTEGNIGNLTSDKQQAAFNAIRDALPQVQKHATEAGIPAGNLGDTYFPQVVDWNKVPKGGAAYNQILQGLVKSGVANNLEDAVSVLETARAGHEIVPGHYGNLVRSRTIELDPKYHVPAQQALDRYIAGASKDIAQSRNFGASGHILRRQIGEIAKEGYDAQTAHDAIQAFLHTPQTNAIMRRFRTAEAIVRLPTAAIAHALQTANVVGKAGYLRTAQGWVDKFAGQDQQFLKDAGVFSDIHGINYQTGFEGKSSRLVAPALNWMMRQNRSVSALVGRDYARSLAAKGDIESLRGLGVEGPIDKTLTHQQELDAAYGMTAATMFRSSPLDTPLWAETDAGRTAGQFRMAYQYKQTGYIWDQVIKQAGKGNLAPFLRLLPLMPLAGEAILDTKATIRGKDRSQEGVGKRLLEDVSAGGLGLPGSLAESALYAAGGGRQTVQGIASLAAPALGEAAQTGYAVGDAASGNDKTLERYALRAIPLVGNRISNAVVPPASPDAVAYATAISDARNHNGLSGDEKIKFDDYTSRQVNDQGQKLQEAPSEALRNARTLWGDDNLRRSIKSAQQSLPNHDPMWDLSDPELKTFLDYQQQYTGDAAKSYIADQNPWISDLISQRNDYYDTLDTQGKSVPNPDTPQRPNISSSTQQLLDDMDTLDSAGKAQLFKDHPELTDALSQIAGYTNEMRKAEGAPELRGTPQASPQLQQVMDAYNQLPKGTGDRSAWIQANPAAWQAMTDYLTQSSVASVIKNVAKAQFKGTDLNQSALKGIKNLGQYDITKNADGTYSLNGGGSSTGSSGSGSSSNPYYNNVSYKKLNDVANPEPTKGKITIKKTSAGTIKIKKLSRVPKKATRLV